MASAQTAGGGQSGTIDSQVRPEQDRLAEPAAPLVLRKPAAGPIEGETAFLVRQIVVEGVTVLDSADVRAVVAAFEGRSLTLSELGGAADAISALYGRAGYALSFAMIPEQTVQDGVVRIRVIEGRIDRILVNVNAGGALVSRESISATVERAFAALADGQPVRAAALETAALRVRDLAGITPRITVRASQTIDGAADLIVEVEVEQATGEISFDNRLRYEFGRYAATAQASLYSIFGTGDALSITGRLGADTDAFKYGGLAYDHAIGTSGVTLHVSGSAARTRAQRGLLGLLQFGGKETTATAGVRWAASRSRRGNLSFEADLSAVNTRSDAFGITLIEDRARFASFAAVADMTDADGAFSAARLGLMQGIAGLGATPEGDALASRAFATPDFTAITFRLYHDRPLGDGFRVTLSADGQRVISGSTSAAVECAYGGQRYGRAYDAGAIGGDHCLRGSAEVSRVFEVSPGWVTQPYVFVDGARVRQEGRLVAGEARRQSAGSAGAGLRLLALGRVTADAVATVPFATRYAEAGGKIRVYASLGMRF